MSDYSVTFRKVADVYRVFNVKKTELYNGLEKERKSGKYSGKYLWDRQANVEKETNKQYEACLQILVEVRGEFENHLRKEHNLLAYAINPRLTELLNSGIDLTCEEWKQLAKASANNMTESRLLHDTARQRGFTLDNYSSVEQKLLVFDNMTRHITDAMLGIGLIDVTESEISEMCGRYCRQASVPSFDCFVTPKTIEAEIARDVMGEEADSVIDVSFEEGFAPENVGDAEEMKQRVEESKEVLEKMAEERESEEGEKEV